MGGFFFALLSALLLTLSFPPFDLEFFAWVALVPLLISLKGRRPLSAFGLSFITGIGFFIGISYWTLVVESLELIHFLTLEAYLGFYYAVFGLLFNLWRNRYPAVLTAPLIWVSMEYIRSHAGFLEFPWALLGYSQYENLPLIQIASITGAYGVSFLIVMVNAAFFEVVLSLKNGKQSQGWFNRFKPMIAPIILLGVTLAYGYAVISKPLSPERVAVSVIQANIPQVVRWNPELREQHLQKHISLTKQAAAKRPGTLIIWP